MASARFQTNGVDVLIDAIQAAHEDPADVRDRLWQAAWARGYQDVVVPLPIPDSKIEGYVVLGVQYPSGHGVLCVDDGEHLVGILDQLAVPPLGARVRMQPMYGTGTQWVVKVLAVLGCGLEIRFDDSETRTTDVGWVDRLRQCLAKIREGELAVRRQIEGQRRTLQFVQAPPSFRSEMETADKELRERVLAGGYTEDEKRQLNKAKTPEAVQKIIAERNKRLVDAYRREVVEFRAQIPALRAAYDEKMEEYANFRNAIDHFNEVDGSSRGITDTTLRASQQLDTIESALLNVRVVDLHEIEENPRKHVTELAQTIDLLFDIVPKRLQKAAASQAAAS